MLNKNLNNLSYENLFQEMFQRAFRLPGQDILGIYSFSNEAIEAIVLDSICRSSMHQIPLDSNVGSYRSRDCVLSLCGE